LTDRNKAIVLKVDRHLVDTQEHHPHIFLNMVVCLNKDHNQPDRWLTSSRQLNMEVNRVATAARLSNPQLVTEVSRWVMEALHLQAPVDMAAASLLLMLSGLSQLLNPLETASKAIRVEQ
jgi:hypothetical protein